MRAAKAQVGDRIGAVSFVLTRADLRRYATASGDHNPIHLDEEAAKAAGLPGVIAHGMLTMGQVIWPLVEWAGGDPGAIREYTVRFARPVVVPADGGAELTVEGQVTAVAGSRVTVALAVTASGQKVLGKAQAVIELPAA
ncbi:MAG: MaoC family dehydratase N-terminal domain-containing protein [Bifidobacteriaceae bacterium]|jgi:acyl dehydratase|nr:MaoC family dehydratase N-terminal domain-containing protein [Bifidobacteriaceae bacterium]